MYDRAVAKLKREKKRALAALKEENRILRAEIKRLNRTLRAYSVNESKRSVGAARLLSYEHKKALSLASSSYIKYLISRITRASFYGIIQKAAGGFRKFKLVSNVMRVVSSSITLIGTGAFFIFISGVSVFFVPLTAILSIGAYLASMLFRKSAFRAIEKSLSQKSIIVLFPPSGRPFEKDSLFSRSLLRLQNKDTFIIIVSPYFLSAKGFGEKGYYPVARFESDGSCIIRKHSFFAFRRKILGKYSERTIYVY